MATRMTSNLLSQPKSGFTFSGHGLATYPAGSTFGPRTQIDYEFVWILDGEVVWHCDGTDVPAPAGTLLLARPGMRDGFTWDPTRPTRHGFIHFHRNPGLVSGDLPPESTWPLARRLGAGDVLLPLLHHLGWLRDEHPPGWESLAQSALAHALAAFIHGSAGGAEPSQDPLNPLIERVIGGMQQRWSHGPMVVPSLTALAKLAGVSRAHLVRVFRRECGATPVEALRLLRLDRAANLLARTNEDVTAIADRCGFANAFHFSRSFRSVYRQPPSAFRQSILAGGGVPTLKLVRLRRLSARM